ncbi:MAG TPA: carboxypeptidase M32 [Lacipirellulaceae bacterium]|jgi:carboxypeptidase Taq|nr:carboxypeptidase M32 [Lacipirellulaceae bacterium]
MTNDQARATYEKLCTHAREVAILNSTQSLLGWDERTKLPPAGGEYRAEQMSYLAGLTHKKLTAPEIGDWLIELADSDLAADPHSDSGADIVNMRRDYERKTKLPQALVEELAKLSVLGQQLWVEARKANDFARFRPLLERTLELKRQEAAAIGYEKEPYDALLDEFEPGAKTSEVAHALNGLREQLVPLVAAIAASPRKPNLDALRGNYPVDLQEQFGRRCSTAIGFDFNQGRLDTTNHPFCAGMGPYDVRLTTRYDPENLSGSLFSTLHEAGHGIYDQGLRKEHYGLPTGDAVSLGIHESQSRMWENLVGRSYAFWEFFFPIAQQTFGAALGRVALDDFYFAINDVRPSLIRTESDEVTYNLHILIRFELELALINDQLKVADLPEAWHAKYREYLGIQSPTDADGVLQDVHWSSGAFGYFPTYSLGNLYAAQFFEQATADLGDLHGMFARGEFMPLREWLRKNIHAEGRRYPAAELGRRVTGKALSHDALMRHLRTKFMPLYDLH